MDGRAGPRSYSVQQPPKLSLFRSGLLCEPPLPSRGRRDYPEPVPRPRDPRLVADVERELSRLLRGARVTSTTIAREVHPDLDVSAYSVLVTVRELAKTLPDGVRAADVGEALHLHKSTMSRTISVLERLGLIERVPSPDDARARLLTLTATGEASLDAALSARRERTAEVLGQWSAPDLRDLARLLATLMDDLAP